MARTGLGQKIQASDSPARLVDNLRDVIETLARDHDVVSAPAATLIASGIIPPGAAAVVFTGGPTQTLTLPPANALGASVVAVIFFLNTSPNAVTLVPSRGDSVNGGTSLSVAAGALVVLACDGVNKWLRNA